MHNWKGSEAAGGDGSPPVDPNRGGPKSATRTEPGGGKKEKEGN